MAELTDTDYTKIASESGERFIDSYYSALDGARGSIKSFYVPTVAQENGRGLPNVTFNGELISDTAAFQERWEKEMPRTHFDAQSVNVHVLNPMLKPLEGMKRKDAERNMSLIVQVSGAVRIGQPKEGPLRGFSDSFVLVPNPELAGGVGTGKQDHGRQWLIQSQTFRFVHPLYNTDTLYTTTAMKCHKIGTDQSLDLVFYANGIPCKEFVLPHTADSDPNIVQCFVPVEEGREISIRGTFTGSVLHGSLDLIADGSFLADRRIEAPRDGKIRHYTDRKIDIRSVFDAPKAKGHTSVFAPDKVVEGLLHIKALGERSETANAFPSPNELGIGSLAIVVSLGQRTGEDFPNQYKSLTCGDPDIGRKGDDDGGIPPSYELMVRAMEGEVTKQRQSKHKRHAEQTRAGPKPWAKLIFYYRSREAIEEFECVEREEESQALEAGDAGTFIQSSIENARPKQKKGDGEAGDDSLFATPPPGKEERVKATPRRRSLVNDEMDVHSELDTPKAGLQRKKQELARSTSAPIKTPMKGRLMIGSKLDIPADFVRSSHTQQHETREQPASDGFDKAMQKYQGEAEEQQSIGEQYDDRLPSFGKFNPRKEMLPTTCFAETQEEDVGAAPQNLSEEELEDTIEDAEAFLGDVSQRAQRVAAEAQIFVRESVENGDDSGWQDVDLPMDEDEEGQQDLDLLMERDGEIDARGYDADSLIGKERSMELKEEEQTTPAPSQAGANATETSFVSPPPFHQHSDNNIETRIASLSRSLSPQAEHTSGSEHDRMSAPPSPAADAPASCTLSIDDIRPHIPAEGITLLDLKTHFTEDQVPTNIEAGNQFMALVKKIARQKAGGKYFLKTTRGSQGASPSQSQSQVEKKLSQRNSQASPTKLAAVVDNEVLQELKIKPEIVPKIERADTPAMAESSPAPTSSILANSTVSKKRSASTYTGSRESTPSTKKPRFDAMAARKAEIKQKLEEQQKRRIAMQKQIQEMQELREEHDAAREEAEEKELAMMERQLAEDVEETEAMAEMARAEREMAEEAVKERDRAVEALRTSEEA